MGKFEVYLQERKSGKPKNCIYSGDEMNEACAVADAYNRFNLPDYNEDTFIDDYIDGVSEGLAAELYYITNRDLLHGVGEFADGDVSAISERI